MELVLQPIIIMLLNRLHTGGQLEVVCLLLKNDSKYKVDSKAEDNFDIKHDSRLNKQAIIKLLEEYGTGL
jgi:hypothetical protein